MPMQPAKTLIKLLLKLNSLDPDQARHFVGSDLGPNCLQMLSADLEDCTCDQKAMSECMPVCLKGQTTLFCDCFTHYSKYTVVENIDIILIFFC